MSPHKEEERRKAEVEAEVVKEEEDSREVITKGRTILTEDNLTEVAGNLEVEEEEVVMTGAQTRESLEWLAEPLTRTGVTTAMSLDISQENAPRGIMANNNNRPQQHKTFPGFNVPKVPNYNSFCITHFEAEKVYKCVESDQIVSPLVFHKDFQPPIE